MVSGFEFRFSGIGFRISDFWYRNSGFGGEVDQALLDVLELATQLHHLPLRLACIRVLGLGSRGQKTTTDTLCAGEFENTTPCVKSLRSSYTGLYPQRISDAFYVLPGSGFQVSGSGFRVRKTMQRYFPGRRGFRGQETTCVRSTA